MNQVWLPLECNEPDLRLWSLNVIALLHSENEKMMEFGLKRVVKFNGLLLNVAECLSLSYIRL